MNKTTYNIHEDIIKRCRIGDGKAQYELYQLYAKAMFNTALRICGSREEAEDALQEAFVSAFGNISSYRGEAAFGAWLKRIVINKSLNSVKSSRRATMMVEEIEKEAIQKVEVTQETEFSVEAIKDAVGSLAPGFRNVLTLYLFEGYDHQEISEILNISESTSKTQYKRAKEKLRLKLNEVIKYG